MLLITLLFLALFFLTGVFFLTAFVSAFRTLSQKESTSVLLSKRFFYGAFHRWLFPEKELEGLFFVTICSQSITRLIYGGLLMLFLEKTGLFEGIGYSPEHLLQWTWVFLIVFSSLIFSFVVSDFLPRLAGTRLPSETFSFSAPIASIFMFVSLPITFIFLKISRSLSRSIYLDRSQEPLSQTKREIIEIVNKATVSPHLDPHDKQLIESVLEFKERIAREIMVPRVNIFGLQSDTSILQAAKLLDVEGYSRVPVYKNTVDEVVGVLMYKDVIAKFLEYIKNGNDPAILNASIETIMKNVLYTPETKKISHLLQDFKRKKVHQAIVVDEYGGTEGIVTIEDILEEIVGEISDEYDEDDQVMILKADDGWVVNARLSILDAEERLGITFPEEGDYDTIGGFIFHEAGTIPLKGYVIQTHDFEFEVLKSNERFVEKVKIRPITTPDSDHEENEGYSSYD